MVATPTPNLGAICRQDQPWRRNSRASPDGIQLAASRWAVPIESLTSVLDAFRSHAFGVSHALLFGNPSGNGDHQFTGWASRAEVFFFETHKLNTVGCEPLDVLEGFSDAFTPKAVEPRMSCFV